MVEYTCIYQKSMQNVERGKAFASSSLTLHFMLLHMKCNAGVLAQPKLPNLMTGKKKGMVKGMLILCCLVVGIAIGAAEYWLLQRKKWFPDLPYRIIKDTIIVNLLAIAVMKYFLKIPDVFYISRHGPLYFLKYLCFALCVGAAVLFLKGIFEGVLTYEREERKQKAGFLVGKVISILLFAVGAAAFTATNWGKRTFGDITPDQFLVNLKSPIVGTSSDVMVTAFEGPVFETAVLTMLFSIFVCSVYRLVLHRGEKLRVVFGRIPRLVLSLVLAVAVLAGGLVYGVKKFQLVDVYHAYVSDSSYIQDHYVSPRDVKLIFPKEKRNLIHIYLESIETTYLSKELGGYMKTNLMPELTQLAGEGVSFSHTPDTFGGPRQTVGSSWSVAAMVNMELGLPLKIPMNGNSYGKSGKFLPGAVGIGDILKAQGYEQTIMFGADSDFGGLTSFFQNHGDFNFMDYKAVKEKGLIPKDYKVWWGYEDDKLYEFAKEELIRLSKTGKPFHLNMETADTHFPDGYLSPGVKDKHGNQYANVISYSTAETVRFIRWIQQQDFYPNTTIVLTGDHWSMDQKFFAKVDKKYRRAIFNLILNAPVKAEKAYGREFAPFDFYPTILASLGVQIEGDRLGLGTNLFSGAPTLVERDDLDKVNQELNERSNFYNDEFIAEWKNSTFENTKVSYQ